jgi:hypothetical protein
LSPKLGSVLDVLHRDGIPSPRQLILSLRFIRYRFSIALWPVFLDWHDSFVKPLSSANDFRFLFLRVQHSGSGEGDRDWEELVAVGDDGSDNNLTCGSI